MVRIRVSVRVRSGFKFRVQLLFDRFRPMYTSEIGNIGACWNIGVGK